MKLEFPPKSVFWSCTQTDFGKNPFSGPAHKRILEMECRLLFSVFARKRLDLGYTHCTSILKSVFVVVVKRKREIGISFKIRFLVLHANGFWKSNVDFCFPFLQENGWPLGRRIHLIFMISIFFIQINPHFRDNTRVLIILFVIPSPI